MGETRNPHPGPEQPDRAPPRAGDPKAGQVMPESAASAAGPYGPLRPYGPNGWADPDPELKSDVRDLDPLVTGGAYGVLAVTGILLGLIGSLQYSWTVSGFPWLAIVLGLVNFAVCRLAGWGMGGKLGAVVPAVGWLLAVMPLTVQRAEGDLIIAGTTAGYVFLFGGSIAAAIAIGLVPTTRPWLLVGASPEIKKTPE